ncbi:hypothetical protein KM043_005048 [Ampulex compressa]|nr:hypothetical protein KM043_005048 [Ampulex compressa]
MPCLSRQTSHVMKPRGIVDGKQPHAVVPPVSKRNCNLPFSSERPETSVIKGGEPAKGDGRIDQMPLAIKSRRRTKPLALQILGEDKENVDPGLNDLDDRRRKIEGSSERGVFQARARSEEGGAAR